MLNQLEKIPEDLSFFRVDSMLPSSVQMRFHSKTIDELGATNKFYKTFKSIAQSRQGIYRCDLLQLAKELGVKPYSIPKMLYSLQHNSDDDIAYDLDGESFVLQFHRIPDQSMVYRLSQEMLKETRRIEQNLVSKLNCMYFAARKVSLPNVEYMLK